MPNITIRTAKAADVGAVTALANQTYVAAFGHSMSPEDLAAHLLDTRSESYFEAALQTDVFILAFDESAIVGYVQLCGQPQDGSIEINALYVASAMQGQGIGTALLEAASAHPHLAEARRITLDVWKENPRAIAFYQRHGFAIVGKRDFTVRGRVLGTDLIMRCALLRFS